MRSTCVVVGAGRGIGLELAKLFRQTHAVTATSRRPSSALDALEVDNVSGVDVCDRASLSAVAGRFDASTIDLLVVVPGVLHRDTFGSIDDSQVQAQLDVNALGPLRVVEAFSDRLRDGAKVVVLTSRMGSMADNTSGGYYGYRMSKAALNAAAVSLAHDLRHRNIAVGILHPGFVQTDMTGGAGDLSPAESAALLVTRISELSVAQSGKFFHANGENLPW